MALITSGGEISVIRGGTPGRRKHWVPADAALWTTVQSTHSVILAEAAGHLKGNGWLCVRGWKKHENRWLICRWQLKNMKVLYIVQNLGTWLLHTNDWYLNYYLKYQLVFSSCLLFLLVTETMLKQAVSPCKVTYRICRGDSAPQHRWDSFPVFDQWCPGIVDLWW